MQIESPLQKPVQNMQHILPMIIFFYLCAGVGLHEDRLSDSPSIFYSHILNFSGKTYVTSYFINMYRMIKITMAGVKSLISHQPHHIIDHKIKK